MSLGESRLPQLSQLLNALEAYLSGRDEVEVVLQKLSKFQKWRRSLRALFQRILSFDEKSKTQDASVSRLQTLLDRLKFLASKLEAALRKREKGEARDLSQGLLKDVEEIHTILNDMKQKEVKGAGYSRVPMVNEIVRLGYAFRKGTFPREKYREVIGKSIAYHKAYYSRFKTWAAEKVGMDETLKERLRKSLKRVGECLAKILQEIDTGKLLEESLKRLVVEADALHAAMLAFDAWQRSIEPLVCVRCGHANPQGSRFCAGCAAALPRLSPEET